MSVKISSLTQEYLEIQISCSIDPRSYPVYVAFAQPGQDPSTWLTASWKPDETDPYACQILIGANTMAKGRYEVWVKIAANPEIPVRWTGSLEVL